MIEDPPLVTVRRPKRRPTEAQIAAFRDAPTGFVVDALLAAGVDGGGALDATITPFTAHGAAQSRIAGPAWTADCGPGDVLASFAALRFLRPGDVMVAAFDGHQGCAAAGDRLVGMMRNAGAIGFVTDGPVRDGEGVAATRLPVWCAGVTPATPFTSGPGMVGTAVQLGGRRVAPGDMIVADADGVVVAPFEALDVVAARLGEIKTMEAELDAKVAAGLIAPAWVDDMLAGSKTRYLE